MAEMTIEQQRAIAIANARKRAAESASAPPAASTAAAEPNIYEDVGRSAATGLAKGAIGLPGLPGDVELLTRNVGGWLGNKIRDWRGLGPVPISQDTYLPTSDEVVKWSGYEGYKPQTRAGRIAETAGEFIPGGIVLGPAGPWARSGKAVDLVSQALKNAGKYGAAPGAVSEGAGQLAEGTPLEPYARVGGALVAGGAGAVRRPKVPDAPTVDELKAASQTLYKSQAVKGMAIEPFSFDMAVGKIAQDVKQAGIDKTLHPDSMAALKRLEDARGTAPTLEELDTLRQIAGDAAMSVNPREARIASKIVQGIDDYLNNLKPADVISGDPKTSVEALTKARELWAKKSKGETIDIMFERAKNAVGANYTQAGFQTAIRQQFRWLADPKYPQRMRGWTPAEKAAVNKVVRGGPIENVLRLIGRGAARGPFTGGLAAAVTYAGGPLAGGAYLGATEAAKRAAQGIGTRNAEIVSALVRGGAMPLPSDFRQFPGLSLMYGTWGLPADKQQP